MHPFAPEGPYHSVILGAGALDTKGGPVIDPSARVLTPSGEPIPGNTAPATASPPRRDRPTGALAAPSGWRSRTASSPDARPRPGPPARLLPADRDARPPLDAQDIIEIHQLLNEYGHIVDAQEWDRFDELFLPDAELGRQQPAGGARTAREAPAVGRAHDLILVIAAVPPAGVV